MKRFLPLLLLITGCATYERESAVWPYPDPPQPDWPADAPRRAPAGSERQESPGSPQDTDPASLRASSPAVDSLLSQAREERYQGDYERAAATLERALRIAPQDPVPWYEFAQLRFEQSNLVQAENLARRCLSFAGQQVAVKRAAWRLIADIKALQGDSAGEREALARARDA